MKNEPTQIFLQLGEGVEPDTDFNELTGVSWCADKINKNDIQYNNPRVLLENILSKREEIIGGALRVEFIRVSAIKAIFEQYGIKEEPKF